MQIVFFSRFMKVLFKHSAVSLLSYSDMLTNDFHEGCFHSIHRCKGVWCACQSYQLSQWWWVSRIQVEGVEICIQRRGAWCWDVLSKAASNGRGSPHQNFKHRWFMRIEELVSIKFWSQMEVGVTGFCSFLCSSLKFNREVGAELTQPVASTALWEVKCAYLFVFRLKWSSFPLRMICVCHIYGVICISFKILI